MSSILSDFGRLVWVGLAVVYPVLAQAQNPLVTEGAEALLGGGVPGNQVYPGLSLDTGGGFVVWQDNNVAGGSGWDIQARRLDEQGAGLGMPFRVNAGVSNNQERPQVTVLKDGGAAFVWQGGPVGFQTVYARFMARSGSFLSPDLQVSRPLTASTNRQSMRMMVIRNNRPAMRRFLISQVGAQRRDFATAPAAATLADGNVALAYASYQRFTTNRPVVLPRIVMYGATLLTNSILVAQERGVDNMLDVFVRRFTPGGLALGQETHVNQVSKFNQRNVALAALPNGNFVVVWVSENHGVSDADLAHGLDRQDVFARLFNAAGLPLTDEFLVNDLAHRVNAFPAVAALAGGGFRVVWAQNGAARLDGLDIVTRAFDALANPASGPSRVNSYLPGDQLTPRVASCPAGDLVVWTSLNQDGSKEGVFGQWLAGGSPVGAEFRVNTSAAGSQYQPAVVATPGQRVLVAWAGLRPGSAFDIFSQRFSASNP
jgi:hypothetical protein